MKEFSKFLINLMSIFYKAVGGNWSNWRKPTQAEEENVRTLPVQLSETCLTFWSELFCVPSSFPLHRFIPSWVHTGAYMALCPCEASITCPSPTSWNRLQPAAIHME